MAELTGLEKIKTMTTKETALAFLGSLPDDVLINLAKAILIQGDMVTWAEKQEIDLNNEAKGKSFVAGSIMPLANKIAAAPETGVNVTIKSNNIEALLFGEGIPLDPDTIIVLTELLSIVSKGSGSTTSSTRRVHRITG